MSLHRHPIDPIPEETTRVARAAFPKSNRYMCMRESSASSTTTRPSLLCSQRDAWHTRPVARAVDAPVDARSGPRALTHHHAALDLAS